ncbi:unnamed protein product [Tetraodon nigroviridis]|uniref:(spotted green pufferfish) hypothetical protein n=1 Tax=Tetraodon nigroviridis TaxID=99883 RepID=Q4RIW7_TETNG|nr:unnamed protein product [Tetraodon nigroviridis]
MLESIKVTERLHWPKAEVSRKCVLKSADGSLSPSQVHLEKLSSGVFRDLFSSASYSLLQTEEARSPKRSLHKRSNTKVKCGAAFAKRKPASAAPKKGRAGAGTPAQASRLASGSNCSRPAAACLAVVGSSVEISSRALPKLREACVSSCARSKGPGTLRAAGTREAESARKLCILSAVKPTNVECEKVKFFQSGFSYNPQFQYSSPASSLVLSRHGNASDRFLSQVSLELPVPSRVSDSESQGGADRPDLQLRGCQEEPGVAAVRILELVLRRYGSYEAFQRLTGGSLLSRSRIWHSVKKYMEKEGCAGEVLVQVTDDLLSRASMTVVNSRPTLTINASTAREHWLEGMLRHEIGGFPGHTHMHTHTHTAQAALPPEGTHYFRGMNNCQQPWGRSEARRRLSLKPPNPTEEGLASLHSVLLRKDPLLWRAALLYYTVHQASLVSFSQLFSSLGRFVQDPHTRWDYCVRAKRGQSDTAQPGCFSKDQMYLDGLLRILRHRDSIDFPLLVALGKVSFDDVERLRPLARLEKVRIPHFMQDQARYAQQLARIMAANQLTDEELRSII